MKITNNLHFTPGIKIFKIYLVSINVSVQVYDPFINIHKQGQTMGYANIIWSSIPSMVKKTFLPDSAIVLEHLPPMNKDGCQHLTLTLTLELAVSEVTSESSDHQGGPENWWLRTYVIWIPS